MIAFERLGAGTMPAEARVPPNVSVSAEAPPL
jgi:hypothetical protein